jgi:hypothetical protein
LSSCLTLVCCCILAILVQILGDVMLLHLATLHYLHLHKPLPAQHPGQPGRYRDCTACSTTWGPNPITSKRTFSPPKCAELRFIYLTEVLTWIRLTPAHCIPLIAHIAFCKSQMTSRVLRHTAAAMRTHNVLCNSYNSRDKPLQLSSCTFCVVVHSYSFENCIGYFHSSKLVYHGTPKHPSMYNATTLQCCACRLHSVPCDMYTSCA